MNAPSIEPGQPAEIGKIDRELGKLWAASGDTKTRASLINLAIYTEDASALGANTTLIAEIAGQHACRAILIVANPLARESRARAWINTHCHLAEKFGHQTCSEQITFQLDGGSASALPNIVFSHLDSDLPLCFWWQGEFRESQDEKFWGWVDRLIFDSGPWSDPARQFAIVHRIGRLADARTTLCDLNWTRLHRYRLAVASLFDHAGALPCLDRITSAHITAAPGCRTTALLLLGWVAAQLKWTLPSQGNFFTAPDGRPIRFEVIEAPGACISLVELSGDDACFHLARQDGFFHAKIQVPGMPATTLTLSSSEDRLADTLVAELGRGGRHPLYAKSLAVVLPLFDRPAMAM